MNSVVLFGSDAFLALLVDDPGTSKNFWRLETFKPLSKPCHYFNLLCFLWVRFCWQSEQTNISAICAILDCNRSNVVADRSHNLNSHTILLLFSHHWEEVKVKRTAGN
jgi:hypothetical protein